MSVYLTELEYQILQTFGAQMDPSLELNWGLAETYGEELFGSAWVQHLSYGKEYAQVVISLTFGRLRRKGLITRSDSTHAKAEHRSWGLWSLTPIGHEVLGLVPSGA